MKGDWQSVCELDRLPVGRGACALVDGEQVALFRRPDGWLHALANLDPFSGAMVLSRGLLGSRGDRPIVTSPMYKQAFDLLSGVCLDEPEVHVPIHRVRTRGNVVEVQVNVRLVSANAGSAGGIAWPDRGLARNGAGVDQFLGHLAELEVQVQ